MSIFFPQMTQLVLLVAIIAAFESYSEAHSISCKRLTTRELERKLDFFGGYNKRYQAITRKDAKKFLSLLNQQKVVVKVTPYNNITKKLFRSKRQTISSPQTNINSVAQRGSLDQRGLHRLCTESSAVTTLPADYFPRFLNEVICDTVDSGCLSHEGVCVQGGFVVEVLKKNGTCGSDGKEIWEVVSQPVRSRCNCRLYPGSKLTQYL